jgi:ATP-binding cassette subfamily F protein 3
MSEDLASIVESSLASFVDEDICEYIQSSLADDPHDADAREAVAELLRGSIESEDDDPEDIITAFFERLGLGENGGNNDNRNNNNNSTNNEDGNEHAPLKRLDQAVTMKVHDVQTFAGGLIADKSEELNPTGKQSSIAEFYANMIDVSGNEAAMSERRRRKERQKALRLELEEAERKRALKDAMDILNEEDAENNDDPSNPDAMMHASNDNRADVQLKNLDLPNLRGGGPDLLSNASLTLAQGRRYGLMGRNGCGKTTLMTFMAQRQITGGIPKNMSMLLVRQEIAGDDKTAVQMVLKSDVKREGVKRFIKWCEEEIERLENGGELKPTTTTTEEAKEGDDQKKSATKGKQRLQDRKNAKAKKAIRAKATTTKEVTDTVKKNSEYQKTNLSEKLIKAYERLAQIEEEEGSDPEPRARKILSGLGFSNEMQDKPTQELSGGWRMRVSLSCALFADPSLLLLDEPTNHLDLPGVLWLESYLNTKFKGTLVVVSHDRHFLNEICTDIVHFYKSELKTYRGDVTNYEAVREEDKKRQIRLRENQESQKAHLQKYIDLHSQSGENGVSASKQRKSRMKKLDKVGMMNQEGKRWKASYDGDAEEVEEFVEDENVVLNFPDPGGFDGAIAKLEEVNFGYSKENILLRNVDLTIDLKSRTALLGRNGGGKYKTQSQDFHFPVVSYNLATRPS